MNYPVPLKTPSEVKKYDEIYIWIWNYQKRAPHYTPDYCLYHRQQEMEWGYHQTPNVVLMRKVDMFKSET